MILDSLLIFGKSITEILTTIIPIGISIVSLIFSLLAKKASERQSSYLEIDNQYKSLLEIGVKNPKFRDSTFTEKYLSYKETDPDLYNSYSTYAYMIWNFVETIMDISKNSKTGSYNKDIWYPVILEENTLHYKWFISENNSRLFKDSFKKLVMKQVNNVEVFSLDRVIKCNPFYEKMNSEDVLKEENKIFESIYEHYKNDFILEERKTKAQLRKLIAGEYYNLQLVKFMDINFNNGSSLSDLKSNIPSTNIGYMFWYEKGNYILLDYFAIISSYRNCSYGNAAISNFIKRNNTKAIILEVERPNGDLVGLSIRRKAFYERLGAIDLNVKSYGIPSINGKFEMDLMIIPGDKFVYDCNELKVFMNEAISYIHSDLYSTKSVIESYSNEFPVKIPEIDVIFDIGDINVFINHNDKIIANSFDYSSFSNFDVMKKLNEEGKYVLYTVRDRGEVELSGYALVYKCDNGLYFLDYLCINSLKQNKGYGKRLINYILDNIPLNTLCYELPNLDNNNDNKYSLHAEEFSKHIGAVKEEFDYYSPTLEGAVSSNFYILSRRDTIEDRLIKEALNEAITNLYSKYSHTSNVIGKYIDLIHDYKKKE